MVRGVEERLVGLGLSLLQQLGGLAQHELWFWQSGVGGSFPKMMWVHGLFSSMIALYDRDFGRARSCQPLVPLPNNSPKILVVAGEASGDDHAARLVAAMREFCPNAEFLGVGGEEMRAQGVRILTPASELAVVGLMEVVGHLPAIWQALRNIGRVLKTVLEGRDPDAVTAHSNYSREVLRLAEVYRTMGVLE